MESACGAAMLLLFDVRAEATAEHDDWHTHEHLPERLAIPGFMRGSRWIALSGSPRYFVMYEVQGLETLRGAPYLERLNHPTPWTTSMMASYVGMRRAFCRVVATRGAGLGSTALLIRFGDYAQHAPALDDWLAGDLLGRIVKRPGVASAFLFAAALEPAMTREQQIRGRDTGLQSALLVTGYDGEVVTALAQTDLSPEAFAARGATMADHMSGVFHNAITLTAGDAAALNLSAKESA